MYCPADLFSMKKEKKIFEKGNLIGPEFPQRPTFLFFLLQPPSLNLITMTRGSHTPLPNVLIRKIISRVKWEKTLIPTFKTKTKQILITTLTKITIYNTFTICLVERLDGSIAHTCFISALSLKTHTKRLKTNIIVSYDRTFINIFTVYFSSMPWTSFLEL